MLFFSNVSDDKQGMHVQDFVADFACGEELSSKFFKIKFVE